MNNLKKFLPFLTISSLGLFFIPDFLSLETYIYRLSVISIILCLCIWIIGEVDNWGIFPAFDVQQVISKAKEESLSSSILFLSFIILICTIIYAIVN